jgi:Flp pilus assembly protein TadD
LFERRDLEPALTVWRRVIDLAPHRPESHVGYATTLRHMRHFDEADAVLEAATAQFPDASFVWTNHAVTADERGDREEALRRWQAVFERFRHEAIAYAGLGAALKMLGRMAEADALMQQGMQLFPDDPNLAINHAWVAVARGDWPEAVRRWTALRARWPDDPVIRRGLTETLMRSQLAAADAAADHVHVGTVDHASDEHARLHALMMRFESVGENCELGFVQRHFGSEPLGLFRWAGIGYTALLEALDSQFAGIGDAEYTEIVVNATSHEYHSEDSRYGMSMHTFFMEGSAAPDVIKARVCRRLVYLKDKLLNDLRDGDKIFVFNSPTPLSDAELRRLHAALLAYGPVLLLHVAPHADQAVGSVVPVDTHLWRGSLGRTGNDGRMWNIEFDAWLAICQAANRLQAEQGRAVASAPA